MKPAPTLPQPPVMSMGRHCTPARTSRTGGRSRRDQLGRRILTASSTRSGRFTWDPAGSTPVWTRRASSPATTAARAGRPSRHSTNTRHAPAGDRAPAACAPMQSWSIRATPTASGAGFPLWASFVPRTAAGRGIPRIRGSRLSWRTTSTRTSGSAFTASPPTPTMPTRSIAASTSACSAPATAARAGSASRTGCRPGSDFPSRSIAGAGRSSSTRWRATSTECPPEESSACSAAATAAIPGSR